MILEYGHLLRSHPGSWMLMGVIALEMVVEKVLLQVQGLCV